MEKLFENLLQDLEEQKTTDCFFEFDGEEKQILAAHKNVLSLSSPVFYAMLFGPLKESSTISIKDISINCFRHLLWNIYGRKFDLQQADEACELYNAAKKYEIPGSLAIARSYMLKTANISNVSQFHYIASLFDDIELLKVCDDIFATSIRKITKDPKFFISTEIKTEMEIEDVKIDSMLNVALKEYKNSIELEACKEARICKSLGLIRFLTMQAEKLYSTITPENTAKLSFSVNRGLENLDLNPLKAFLDSLMLTCCNQDFYCDNCQYYQDLTEIDTTIEKKCFPLIVLIDTYQAKKLSIEDVELFFKEVGKL